MSMKLPVSIIDADIKCFWHMDGFLFECEQLFPATTLRTVGMYKSRGVRLVSEESFSGETVQTLPSETPMLSVPRSLPVPRPIQLSENAAEKQVIQPFLPISSLIYFKIFCIIPRSTRCQSQVS